MDTDAKLGLVRMEGKIDRIGDALQRGQEDMRALNERQITDIKRIDERLHGHGNRIQILEAKDYFQKGERHGLALSAKAVHWLWGGGVIGTALLIARHFGA